ncbi:MAG: MFS transporter [Promethearchaeota archaeon]|nr:MAG: MFS transporter [Candidatus Lokiarchaeota archaeon]
MTSQLSKTLKPSQVPTIKTFRQYIVIWIGQILSLLGSSIVQFTMIWWITTETQSSMYLSFAAFLGFLPQIILSPFMGVLADKFDRQKIIIYSDLLQAAVTTIIIAGLMFNFMNYTLFFIILALRSVFQTVQSPSKAAIVSSMVPKDRLSRLNGIDYLLSSIVAIAGPAFAALLLKFFTFYQILFVDLITFVFALIPLLFLSIPKLESQPKSKQKKGIRDYFSKIKAGFDLLSSNRPFMILLFTASILNLFIMPFNTLLPYYVNVTNQGTEDELAILMGALKVGLLLGSLISTLKKEWKNKTRLTYFLLTLQFIGYLILSFSPSGMYPLMSSGLFIAGLTFPILNSTIITSMQQKIPQEYQGRIFSILISISGLISPLGIILSGTLENLVGVKLLWILSASIAFLFVQCIWLFTKVSKALDGDFKLP